MKDIDREIKELVEFFNSLEGVRTIGCCQGHDDIDNTGNFNEPYLTFICHNKRTLGMLASFGCAYDDNSNLKGEYKKTQPKLVGFWHIVVLIGEDSVFSPGELDKDGRTEGEYVLYSLIPEYNSYDKPSQLYGDFKELLKYFKWKYEQVYGDSK